MPDSSADAKAAFAAVPLFAGLPSRHLTAVAKIAKSVTHQAGTEVASQGRGGLLWTSHNMYEVEDVCDRVLFLSRGKILLEGDPRTLPREHGVDTLEALFIALAREPLHGKAAA